MTPEKYPYSTVSKQIEAALHIARALGHFQSQKLRVEAVSFAELVFSEDGVLTDGFTTGSEIRDVTAIENHHLTVLSGVFGDLFLESGSVYSEPQNLVITQMLRKLASQADAVKYQTLNGVIADLEVCKSYLAEGRPLDYFQLGQKDFTQSLTLGKYVYGREHELGRICRFLKVERPGVVMLSGDAGIGKSTLLDLISDKLGTESWVFRGRFFQGGQAPYQIFGNIFCQFVLEKRRVEPEFWILSRRKAISVHSWVLEELIPELSCIMGPSDRGSGVGVSQTQYHVRSAILWFFELILTEAKPVVLILDDVQWADRNSLEMVEFLNSQIKEGSFSTVLSFRQSDFSSPFVRDDLAAESWHRFRLLKVKLSGLMASDFQEMLADLVKCEPHGVTELADILSQKTGGNPFEVNQMIRKCLSRKLIRFDSEARRWRWQMKDIKWLTVAANMGRLLSSQIEGQSPTAIQILQIASCFGGEVEGALLAVACEYDEDNMGLHLWAAIDQGILIFSRKASSKLGVYKFSHDRIRGSIYNSLGRLKGEIHLRIGRRLGSSFDAEDGTINRFVLAQQYLKAIPAIQSDTERRDIACLLYVASLDAKRQAGFELALALVSGAAVLLRGAGSDSGSLSFEILKEEADLSFVSGSLKKGEALVRELSTHYPCSLKQAALTNLLVESYIGFGHSAKAIEIGLSFLGKTALSLKQEKISVGFFVRLFLIEVWLRARMWRGRQEKTVACPETAALYDLSINVLTAAWMLGKVDLFGRLVSEMVLHVLQKGQSKNSAFFFSSYAVMLVSTGRYSFGNRVDDFAVELSRIKPFSSSLNRVLHVSASFIKPWKSPLSEVRPVLAESLLLSRSCGDLRFEGLTLFMDILIDLFTGVPLPQIQEKCKKGHKFFENIYSGKSAGSSAGGVGGTSFQTHEGWISVRLVQELCQKIGVHPFARKGKCKLSQKSHLLGQKEDGSMPVVTDLILRIMTGYLCGQFSEVVDLAEREGGQLKKIGAIFFCQFAYFFVGLSALRLVKNANPSRKQELMNLARKVLYGLRVAARASFDDFGFYMLMMEAEFTSVGRNPSKRMVQYSKAQACAEATNSVMHQAIYWDCVAELFREEGLCKRRRVAVVFAKELWGRWTEK